MSFVIVKSHEGYRWATSLGDSGIAVSWEAAKDRVRESFAGLWR